MSPYEQVRDKPEAQKFNSLPLNNSVMQMIQSPNY